MLGLNAMGRSSLRVRTHLVSRLDFLNWAWTDGAQVVLHTTHAHGAFLWFRN